MASKDENQRYIIYGSIGVTGLVLFFLLQKGDNPVKRTIADAVQSVPGLAPISGPVLDFMYPDLSGLDGGDYVPGEYVGGDYSIGASDRDGKGGCCCSTSSSLLLEYPAPILEALEYDPIPYPPSRVVAPEPRPVAPSPPERPQPACWTGDNGIPDWRGYVTSHGDLNTAFLLGTWAPGENITSMEQWGITHYQMHGKTAGRCVPLLQ